MNKQTLEPKPPNDEGETICHVRWMAETPAGWLGSWDRQAFDWVNAELDRLRADRDALRGWLEKCHAALHDGPGLTVGESHKIAQMLQPNDAEDAIAAAFEAGKVAERDRCRYPQCLDNEDERCARWLTGECAGPNAEVSGGLPSA